MIPQFARHVDQFGYNGEGLKLAEHVRNKTPTIESLYTDEPSEQRTYSEAWQTWGQDPVQDPFGPRVGAKSKAAGDLGSRGAAPSAPDRSTSVGSWIGRDLLPPPRKGKGKGEETSSRTAQQGQPSLRTSSPTVLPLTTKAGPPPKARPQVSPAPKVRVVATPKQPSYPPPQERAPAPITQPRLQFVR